MCLLLSNQYFIYLVCSNLFRFLSIEILDRQVKKQKPKTFVVLISIKTTSRINCEIRAGGRELYWKERVRQRQREWGPKESKRNRSQTCAQVTCCFCTETQAPLSRSLTTSASPISFWHVCALACAFLLLTIKTELKFYA